MSSPTRRWIRGAIAALALVSAACGPGGSLSNSETYKPPPPLALVVLVDPSTPQMADELRQLQDVIRTTSTPGESVVVMALEPWRQQVLAELERRTGSPVLGARAPDAAMLSATLTAGLTTLSGLPGRRLLLVMGGGEMGPGALAPRSLVDVNLVVANLADANAAAAWTTAATNAGAKSVSALDPALTRLELAQVINR